MRDEPTSKRLCRPLSGRPDSDASGGGVSEPSKAPAERKGKPFLADIPKPDDETLMELFYLRERKGEVSGRPDMAQGILQIALDEVIPDPKQPRQNFDSESIEELGKSIQAHGQLQPILVRREGDRYVLIAGERRWRACKAIGKAIIDAKVLTVDAFTAFEIAVAENVQRETLLPLEEARAYQRLLEDRGGGQADIARRLGVDRRRVSEKLALLRLPHSVQTLLSGRPDSFSESHAFLLASAPDSVDVAKTARRCVDEGWSLRRLRQAIQVRDGVPGPLFFQNLQLAMNRRGGFTLTVRARSHDEVARTIANLEQTLSDLRATFRLSAGVADHGVRTPGHSMEHSSSFQGQAALESSAPTGIDNDVRAPGQIYENDDPNLQEDFDA